MTAQPPLRLRLRPVDLHLRHTFRLSRGASDVRHNLIIELEHEGVTGFGEAAPNPRYQQDQASAMAAVETMIDRLNEGGFDPRAFEGLARRVAVEGQSAAEAAVDMALRDLAGRRWGAPLYRMLGLDPGAVPPVTFTIGIEEPEAIAEKVAEAEGFRLLKVKMGGPDDRAMLEAVRRATDLPLCVDANEGWSFEEARTQIAWLAEMGVELVEQPLPAGQLEEMRALRRVSPLPLYADESVGRAEDIPRLAGAFDGVNVKLTKCGGIGEALRMIAIARALEMKVMLGCMIESSVAISAAAQISPLVDYADLDGNLLVTNDPFRGASARSGQLVIPDGPGLGLEPVAP